MERLRVPVDPASLSDMDRSKYFENFYLTVADEEGRLFDYRGSGALVDFVLEGVIGIGAVVRVIGGRVDDPHYVLTTQGWRKTDGDQDRAYTPEEMLDIPDYNPDLMVPWQLSYHQYVEDSSPTTPQP